jgi:hypothetical protein
MPHRHLRVLALAAAAALVVVPAAQAADPGTRIPDANPAKTHNLAGKASKPQSTRAERATPGQEMKGTSEGAPVVQPSDADRKAGGAFRTSAAERGTTTPIGTLNIVHSELPGAPMPSVAEAPPR